MTAQYTQFLKGAPLAGHNQTYLEEMYLDYMHDPTSVDEKWRVFFEQYGHKDELISQMHPIMKEKFAHLDNHSVATSELSGESIEDFYRTYGHILAGNDLHAQSVNPSWQTLCAHFQNFQERADLSALYCQKLGFEFMHIENPEERQWWKTQIEHTTPSLSKERLMDALEQVYQAHELERFLGIQFVGQKRFSLEGAEALIPVLNTVIEAMAEKGINDQVIGMAHRGRLNVLVNVLGLSVQRLVDEFKGAHHMSNTTGDVKYHLGHSIDRFRNGISTHVSLNYNPSHLEAVNGVVCGNVRARNDRFKMEPDVQKTKAAGILIHGDASLAGQGSVIEVLNMSQVAAYHTEGTIHIVVNNQIGFTTTPGEDRSTRYCTDVAKSILAPIIHVDADDIESCVRAALMAAEYKLVFNRDVFIDLQGYRKYGHNEADEPRATQPVMYQALKNHPGVAKLFSDQLVKANVIDAAFVNQMSMDIRAKLTRGDILVNFASENHSPRHKDWQQLSNRAPDVKTSIAQDQIISLGERVFDQGTVEVQKQVKYTLDARQKMLTGEESANWGFGELLAYASLIEEGYKVRLVGQDAERGTFSHRHGVLHDQKTGERFCALRQHFTEHAFHIYNSTLSEYGALAYEYGYAETDPNTLVIWEAQFGDFANGAQVIFDQFISSAWQKWKRLCGLVVLLPHGYEGQGPEHSSARIERMLQLCAQNNMQVAVPTTPAQIFHLLRSQMLRAMRVPLIVMTPKSLLRNPMAVSDIKAFSQGQFQRVMVSENPARKSKRVILCQGKIYYELKKVHDQLGLDIPMIRLEMLYPFPHEELTRALSAIETQQMVWVQEEPFNQGPWLQIRHEIEKHVPDGVTLSYCGRDAQASPAVGYASMHTKKQDEIVKQALGLQEE
ncbi:2-oxoglutarate dehydrogenase E1 component [Gammaproteobacteria bacterium]|nr:2-oxoglutarate dehydrogenase E1 component [Gammaproteobacteria bacterium]